MSKPKYLTLKAIPRPEDTPDLESYGSEDGPYMKVEYRDRGGHVVYPTMVFIPHGRFDNVGWGYNGRYDSSEITEDMLVEMATEFINEREPWGYSDISEWKINKGSFDKIWIDL